MSNMHLAVAALAASSLTLAQDSYWIANRASSDIMRVASWGSILERVPTPTTLRSSTTAPDGKVWIVRFIQPTFDIYDPVTNTMTAVPSPGGSPYQIAFDAQGTAWITNGASAVHQFAANGTLIQTVTLPAGAALGITIDANGNKWIAHRVSPASVSRIDSLGVTNFPIVGAGTMLPTAVMADYRGLSTPSRIWVVGDNSSNLAELDVNGATLNVYPMPAGSIGSLAFDRNGDIWVGSFGTGALLQVDENTGLVLNNYSVPPSINGLAMDSYGRLLASVRVTFSGVGPPCELRRIDPATGALEVQARLTLGGLAASGTQAAASTPWQYSWVVAPFGDLDGDGEINWAEVNAGTSPIDPTSRSNFRVETLGVTQIGSTPILDMRAGASTVWIVGVSLGLVPPTLVPGFGGFLRIDLTTLGLTSFGTGNGTLPLAIPPNPAFIDVEVFAQGVTYNGTWFDFQNVTGIRVW